MDKIFEDEFMDVQAGLVSLCLETIENNADRIYVYCSIEEKSQSFNACFRCGGEIKTLNQMGIPMRRMVQFLRTGSGDLQKVRDVCANYGKPVPTEMKMVYDVQMGKFESKYRYEEICSAKTQKAASEVFDEWVEEIRRE